MAVTRWKLIISAGAFVTALSLAGCTSAQPSGNASPYTSPGAQTAVMASRTTRALQATQKTTPTNTRDRALSTVPRAARLETADGAAAYMKFYFAELNKAFKTHDLVTLGPLATAACATCTALVNGVRSLQKEGHHYGGDLVTIRYATASEFTPSSRRVLVDLYQQAVPILDTSNGRVGQTPKAHTQFVATLTFDQQWTITKMQRIVP